MEKTEGERVLTLDDWHRLNEAGASIAIRVPINGISMLPLVRKNRDPVTILPVSRPLKRGDVVLFYDPNRREHRYVLHRLWVIDGDTVETWGDNCYSSDGRMPVDSIWGIAEKVERGRLTVRLDTEAARRAGILLAYLAHARRRAMPALIGVLKKVLPDRSVKLLKKLRGRHVF